MPVVRCQLSTGRQLEGLDQSIQKAANFGGVRSKLFEGFDIQPVPLGVLVDRAALGQTHEHFNRKERVAARLGVDRVGEVARLFVEFATRRPLHEIGDTVTVEPPKRDAVDTLSATQVGQQR